MRTFFYKLPNNIAQCFWSGSILFHVGAISLTYVLVTSGFDWFYFTHTRSTVLLWFFLPTIVVGYIVPFAVPLGIYVIGKAKKNRRILNSAFALGQVTIIGLFVDVFYKIVTGRLAPELFHISLLDRSREFNFGFMRNGFISGWPSGHTVWAFAMAITLLFLYPESRKIRYLSIVYALYIGLGMSVTFHWFSDVVAGAFIGIATGIVVGKCFYENYIA